MEIVKRIQRMKAIAEEKRAAGLKIGLVPTLGALHEGHMSLVHRSKEMADVTVTSVFVNPQQFSKGEDYEAYPREILGDEEKLKNAHVDFLFYPDVASVYPSGYKSFVTVEGLSDKLCGAARPGHFKGVATIVLKLLNIIQPHFLLLGQKDAQQAVILKRMVKDLNLDVECVMCPTVRDDSGLALSSRNAYLTGPELHAATCLFRALEKAKELVAEGEKKCAVIEKAVTEILAGEELATLEYVALVDFDELDPRESIDGDTLLAVAARIGKTRLIDNVVLKPAEERKS